MNVLALLLNLAIPGIGSFVVGKPGQGIGQILLWGLGLMLTLTAILSIFGIPMMIGAWIWGIVTVTGAASTPQQVHVNVIQQTGSTNSTSSSQPQQDRR